jgi:predicted transcriptional regulator
MLYCAAVLEILTKSTCPLTSKNISKKLNIQKKMINASLMNIKSSDKNLKMIIRNPFNTGKKRPIWFYEK